MAAAALCIAAAGSLLPAAAHAQQVRVTSLTDVNFGMVNNLTVDAVQSQSVCVWANGSARAYSVRATGSGAGGAFVLSSGPASMAYQVRWNDAAGMSNGQQLNPGIPLGGQTTNAQNQLCTNGPPATASLIVVLPATSLMTASQGAYSGTLTLLVAVE
ncbi:hypothetical protein [Sphingomonas xanthus]|uniref:Spore coat protein U domain-containing protein n=1 Tax=Sphingomonas xanthus TaxID=2594473 RepID=A0A516IU32_9SPHN|nr:hypothetical protein [Sphingomonas xanthus]QDP20415.1 hypothetical protein FMM02_10900 [Sphingomonas xanthus]